MIEITALGEFVASYNSMVIPLQPMQKVVILALFCAEGAVSRDGLVEMLWNPPTPGSSRTLNSHLLRIDKGMEAVGGDRAKLVVGVPLGGRRAYRLAEGLDIDVIRFQRLVYAGCEALRQGSFESADTALAQALSLRERGEPLLHAAHRPFAQDHVRRLEEEYKNAVIGHFKTGITLGRHREVLGQVPRFANRWPGERELQAIHIHALYRSSREQEAAEVCRLTVNAVHAAGTDDSFWLDLQRDVLRGTLPRTGPLAASAPVQRLPYVIAYRRVPSGLGNTL